MKSKNVTMKDIAEYTGVSTATVSRVLNDNYPVNIETKKKVLKAMKELNYEPNLVARNLRSRKSNLVAIIVADIKNPYYTNIAKQIDDYLFTEGYNLIICNTDESPKKEKEIIRMLLSRNIDAIAIAPSDSQNTDLSGLIDQNVPIVLLDRKIKDLQLPFVGTDNFKEAYSLTKFLIEKGHRNIGIINGSLKTSTGEERFLGYKKAMEDHGLSIDEKWMYNGGFEEKKAYDVLKRFLQTGDELPTALFSCNNLMTRGAIKALKEGNVDIPDDLSLISFGALANQDLICPRITCIEQDTTYIGRKAAELLLGKLKNKKQPQKTSVIIESIFLPGDSVKEIL
ncbi:MAG: LacI family DNA-binding transcriptional regulator [Thermoactinomyces sp.]